MLTRSSQQLNAVAHQTITDNIYEQRYIKKRIRQAGC